MAVLLERCAGDLGYGATEDTCRDMRLIAEAPAEQSQRLATRARSKAYAGPDPGDRPRDLDGTVGPAGLAGGGT